MCLQLYVCEHPTPNMCRVNACAPAAAQDQAVAPGLTPAGTRGVLWLCHFCVFVHVYKT